MNCFKIGLDLSIRSTGMVINLQDKFKYFIITDKITKKQDSRDGINIKYIKWERDDTKPIDNIERERIKANNIHNIYKAIISAIEVNTLDTIDREVFIEGISYGSANTTSIIELAGLNYLIRSWCIDKGINFNIIPPSQLKKFATGNGAAVKEVMVESFCRLNNWGREELKNSIKIDDIADAYFLSQYSTDNIL